MATTSIDEKRLRDAVVLLGTLAVSHERAQSLANDPNAERVLHDVVNKLKVFIDRELKRRRAAAHPRGA